MAGGRRRGSLHELDLARPAASTRPLRMYVTHHTASATCRATAGHMRAPTSPSLAPASARTAPAAQLYSSSIAINPRTARLGPSSRASQQQPPNESNAAPATRPTIDAAGASSDAPSNNPATSAGVNSSVTPIDVSTNAVTISRFLATIGRPNNRSVHSDPWSACSRQWVACRPPLAGERRVSHARRRLARPYRRSSPLKRCYRTWKCVRWARLCHRDRSSSSCACGSPRRRRTMSCCLCTRFSAITARTPPRPHSFAVMTAR
jgi:hypothetical protein